MKITKRQLRKIIREERHRLSEISAEQAARINAEQSGLQQQADVEKIIAQGQDFFDKVIQLSQDSEDDPSAQAAIDQIVAALADDVEKRSYGYVKFEVIS